MSALGRLVEATKELTDDREYTELNDINHIGIITDKAALLTIGSTEIWFPLSQLRHYDEDIYASDWIIEQKTKGKAA